MRWWLLVMTVGCGGTDLASPDAEQLSGSGSIELRTFTSEPSGAGTSARAEFIARDDCGTTQVGPCSIRGCQPDWYGLAVAAGTVQINSIPPFALYEDGQESAVAYYGDGKLVAFGPGDTRILTVSGASAPAFSTPFVAPATAMITTPSQTTMLTLGSDDLALAWTGGSGFLDVEIAATLRKARCRFDATAGSGVIPAAAFLGVREPAAFFVIETSNEVVTKAADWTMTMTASVDATWSDGAAVIGTIAVAQP